MANYRVQRILNGTLLYFLTLAWLGVWVVGWILGEQGLAEPGFYVFWVFAAASLVFAGLRGSIEE